MTRETARASPSVAGRSEPREGSEPAVWRQPDMSTNENQQLDRFGSIDDDHRRGRDSADAGE